MPSRIIAIGFTAVVLAACQPAAESTAPTEAAPAVAADQAAQDAVWAALEEKYLGMETMPADPIDALEWREVHCNFLAGEIGGDPEQDRAVNARIDELCSQQLETARALKAARATDTAAVARLDAFLARHNGQ
ncbi:hypothetical protein [Brevundimonas sp. NIBR11]|uniref:hypothetical protein n=1 Tax=Brevundimonas sp. NIBR11 TaxID=3015999 RepID=UPI0022F0D71C|nr:hypothetical protein [Brevundimonas sp. NIBR11]WGM30974.1 hypothetical protein KKHFBJBL_01208 [Brevundimonas sp. NIBR11]